MGRRTQGQLQKFRDDGVEGALAAETARVQRAAQAQHSTATEAAVRRPRMPHVTRACVAALKPLQGLRRPPAGAFPVPQQHHQHGSVRTLATAKKRSVAGLPFSAPFRKTFFLSPAFM